MGKRPGDGQEGATVGGSVGRGGMLPESAAEVEYQAGHVCTTMGEVTAAIEAVAAQVHPRTHTLTNQWQTHTHTANAHTHTHPTSSRFLSTLRLHTSHCLRLRRSQPTGRM